MLKGTHQIRLYTRYSSSKKFMHTTAGSHIWPFSLSSPCCLQWQTLHILNKALHVPHSSTRSQNCVVSSILSNIQPSVLSVKTCLRSTLAKLVFFFFFKQKVLLLGSQVNNVLDHSCCSIWLAARVCVCVCVCVFVSPGPDGRECLVKWD